MNKTIFQTMKNFLSRSVFSGGVAVVYFVTNVLGLHAVETSFWTQRRRASLHARGQLSVGLAGGVSSIEMFPAAHPFAFGGVVPSAGAGLVSGISTGARPQGLSAEQEGLVRSIAPYGTIQEAHMGAKGSPLIIHIQDAHGILEAQRNTAAMLLDLQKARGLGWVGMEGAQGGFRTKAFRGLASLPTLRLVAQDLLSLGMIGGPEAAGLSADKNLFLWGVENIDDYHANVNAYKQAAQHSSAFKTHVETLTKAVEGLKSVVYSPAMLEFDRRYTTYHTQSEGLADYIAYLLGTPLGADASLVQLRRLSKALAMERQLDFKKVDAQRHQLIESLSRVVSSADLENLVRQSVLFREGQLSHSVFHKNLLSVARTKGLRTSSYPFFIEYVAYIEVAEGIRLAGLYDELIGLENRVQVRLAVGEQEKRLLAASRGISLLGKLSTQSMSPMDWADYTARRSDILALTSTLASLGAGPVPAWETLEQDLKPFEDFCRLASKRNKGLVENLLTKMTEQKVREAVLVAGGFHTDGLVKGFKERGLSYVVVTPKITEVPKENRYLEAFIRDARPLEKILSGERIFLVLEPPLSEGASGLRTDAATSLLVTDVALRLSDAGLPLLEQRLQEAFPQAGVYKFFRGENNEITVLLTRPNGDKVTYVARLLMDGENKDEILSSMRDQGLIRDDRLGTPVNYGVIDLVSSSDSPPLQLILRQTKNQRDFFVSFQRFFRGFFSAIRTRQSYAVPALLFIFSSGFLSLGVDPFLAIDLPLFVLGIGGAGSVPKYDVGQGLSRGLQVFATQSGEPRTFTLRDYYSLRKAQLSDAAPPSNYHMGLEVRRLLEMGLLVEITRDDKKKTKAYRLAHLIEGLRSSNPDVWANIVSGRFSTFQEVPVRSFRSSGSSEIKNRVFKELFSRKYFSSQLKESEDVVKRFASELSPSVVQTEFLFRVARLVLDYSQEQREAILDYIQKQAEEDNLLPLLRLKETVHEIAAYHQSLEQNRRDNPDDPFPNENIRRKKELGIIFRSLQETVPGFSKEKVDLPSLILVEVIVREYARAQRYEAATGQYFDANHLANRFRRYAIFNGDRFVGGRFSFAYGFPSLDFPEFPTDVSQRLWEAYRRLMDRGASDLASYVLGAWITGERRKFFRLRHELLKQGKNRDSSEMKSAQEGFDAALKRVLDEIDQNNLIFQNERTGLPMTSAPRLVREWMRRHSLLFDDEGLEKGNAKNEARNIVISDRGSLQPIGGQDVVVYKGGQDITFPTIQSLIEPFTEALKPADRQKIRINTSGSTFRVTVPVSLLKTYGLRLVQRTATNISAGGKGTRFLHIKRFTPEGPIVDDKAKGVAGLPIRDQKRSFIEIGIAQAMAQGIPQVTLFGSFLTDADIRKELHRLGYDEQSPGEFFYALRGSSSKNPPRVRLADSSETVLFHGNSGDLLPLWDRKVQGNEGLWPGSHDGAVGIEYIASGQAYRDLMAGIDRIFVSNVDNRSAVYDPVLAAVADLSGYSLMGEVSVKPRGETGGAMVKLTDPIDGKIRYALLEGAQMPVAFANDSEIQGQLLPYFNTANYWCHTIRFVGEVFLGEKNATKNEVLTFLAPFANAKTAEERDLLKLSLLETLYRFERPFIESDKAFPGAIQWGHLAGTMTLFAETGFFLVDSEGDNLGRNRFAPHKQSIENQERKGKFLHKIIKAYPWSADVPFKNYAVTEDGVTIRRSDTETMFIKKNALMNLFRGRTWEDVSSELRDYLGEQKSTLGGAVSDCLSGPNSSSVASLRAKLDSIGTISFLKTRNPWSNFWGEKKPSSSQPKLHERGAVDFLVFFALISLSLVVLPYLLLPLVNHFLSSPWDALGSFGSLGALGFFGMTGVSQSENNNFLGVESFTLEEANKFRQLVEKIATGNQSLAEVERSIFANQGGWIASKKMDILLEGILTMDPRAENHWNGLQELVGNIARESVSRLLKGDQQDMTGNERGILYSLGYIKRLPIHFYNDSSRIPRFTEGADNRLRTIHRKAVSEMEKALSDSDFQNAIGRNVVEDLRNGLERKEGLGHYAVHTAKSDRFLSIRNNGLDAAFLKTGDETMSQGGKKKLFFWDWDRLARIADPDLRLNWGTFMVRVPVTAPSMAEARTRVGVEEFGDLTGDFLAEKIPAELIELVDPRQPWKSYPITDFDFNSWEDFLQVLKVPVSSLMEKPSPHVRIVKDGLKDQKREALTEAIQKNLGDLVSAAHVTGEALQDHQVVAYFPGASKRSKVWVSGDLVQSVDKEEPTVGDLEKLTPRPYHVNNPPHQGEGDRARVGALSLLTSDVALSPTEIMRNQGIVYGFFGALGVPIGRLVRMYSAFLQRFNGEAAVGVLPQQTNVFQKALALGANAEVYSASEMSWLTHLSMEAAAEVSPVLHITEANRKQAGELAVRVARGLLSKEGTPSPTLYVMSDRTTDKDAAETAINGMSLSGSLNVRFIHTGGEDAAILKQEQGLHVFQTEGFFKQAGEEKAKLAIEGRLVFPIITEDEKLDLSQLSDDFKKAFMLGWLLGPIVLIIRSAVIPQFNALQVALKQA